MEFLQDATGMAILALIAIAILGLGTGLMALVFERQTAQQSQQRHAELVNQLLEVQDEFAKLVKLQFIAAQRQQRTDQVLQDMYNMLEHQARLLEAVKDQPTTVAPNTGADVPSQSNYEHAIRLAKDGMSGEQISGLPRPTSAFFLNPRQGCPSILSTSCIGRLRDLILNKRQPRGNF